MNIDIDPDAGFCFGVKKAVEQAEKELASHAELFCLGEIVHNEEEVNRLNTLGLNTLEQSEYKALEKSTVLIRAHGEPPETYEMARKNKINLVEATCPVVLKLQERIRKAWQEVEPLGGTVVIAGKNNHPEIIGLSGQTGHRAVIVENSADVQKINFKKPVRLFAQTTFDKTKYEQIKEQLNAMIREGGGNSDLLKSHNSICGQVSNRIPKLMTFCKSHDVIIFVSGQNSSNGKNLYETCKASNPASHHIASPAELNKDWFINAKQVGISGATSTPLWLMETVAKKILDLQTCS